MQDGGLRDEQDGCSECLDKEVAHTQSLQKDEQVLKQHPAVIAQELNSRGRTPCVRDGGLRDEQVW